MSPSDQSEIATRSQRAKRALVLAGAGAAAAAALVVVVVVSTRDSRSTTTESTTTEPTSTSAGGPIGAASCVEQYSLATLAKRSLAFDGTVETADSSNVTFRVTQWFRGGEGDTVTLESNGLAGGVVSSNSGGLSLEVGGRYLVAGEPPFVWGCGFTQPYEPSTAAEWATAFQP